MNEYYRHNTKRLRLRISVQVQHSPQIHSNNKFPSFLLLLLASPLGQQLSHYFTHQSSYGIQSYYRVQHNINFKSKNFNYFFIDCVSQLFVNSLRLLSERERDNRLSRERDKGKGLQQRRSRIKEAVLARREALEEWNNPGARGWQHEEGGILVGDYLEYES